MTFSRLVGTARSYFSIMRGSVWGERAVLALILLAAAGLRLNGLDWDGYRHYHPDERYLTWVATSVEWPDEGATAFVPYESTFNPYYWPPEAASKGILTMPQDEARKFAYGHLPLYMGVAATRLMERIGPGLNNVFPTDWTVTSDVLNAAGDIEFTHLTAVTRALTALMDVGTVGLLYVLGKRMYGPAVGLLAAALLAFNVMHIQLSHFFITDPYMTFFVTAAVALMAGAMKASADSRTRRYAPWAAAVCAGLAVGSKFAAILLVLPLGITFWMLKEKTLKARLLGFGGALLAAGLAFALTNPFAVLDWTCAPTLAGMEYGPCYLNNLVSQNAMVRGDLRFPFSRQYIGTLPYLYFIEMQVRWGMGPLLGLAAFGGLVWAIVRLLRNRRTPNPAEVVLIAWVLPFFLVTGAFQVKFIRYLQPLIPFLTLYGAAMLWRLRSKLWRWLAVALVLTTTGLYALSFANMYRQPHPWLAAEEWMRENIDAEARVLGEKWDEVFTPLINAGRLTWMNGVGSEDDAAKLEANLMALWQADYLVIASNRVYAVVGRLDTMFPISSQFYPLLFDGSLGYEVVYVGGRGPNLFGYHLWADTFSWAGLTPPAAVGDYLAAHPGLNWGRADESSLVYDQPMVIIFANEGRLSVEEMLALFEIE